MPTEDREEKEKGRGSKRSERDGGKKEHKGKKEKRRKKDGRGKAWKRNKK